MRYLYLGINIKQRYLSEGSLGSLTQLELNPEKYCHPLKIKKIKKKERKEENLYQSVNCKNLLRTQLPCASTMSS